MTTDPLTQARRYAEVACPGVHVGEPERLGATVRLAATLDGAEVGSLSWVPSTNSIFAIEAEDEAVRDLLVATAEDLGPRLAQEPSDYVGSRTTLVADSQHPWESVRTARRKYLALELDEPGFDPGSTPPEFETDFIVVGPFEGRATSEIEALRGGKVAGSAVWHNATGALMDLRADDEVIEDVLRHTYETLAEVQDLGVEVSEIFFDVDFEDQPGRTAGMIRTAAYPREWRSEAPFGYIPRDDGGEKRARNRPASVPGVEPEDLIFDGGEGKIYVRHPETDEVMGSYSWDGYTIGVAQVAPEYQGMGLSGAMLDHIREEYQPDLRHSLTLSYQGRAAAIRDRGNTRTEHDAYIDVEPYNYGSTSPATFDHDGVTEKQRAYHRQLMDEFDKDVESGLVPTGRGGDLADLDDWDGPDMYGTYGADRGLYDANGDKYEFGYDENGDYVGEDGEYNEEGLDEHGESDRWGHHLVNAPGREDHKEDLFSMRDRREEFDPVEGVDEETLDALDASYEVPVYRVSDPSDLTDERIGVGDTVYTSLAAARRAAQHPTNPLLDRPIAGAYVDTSDLLGTAHPSLLDEADREDFDPNRWTVSGEYSGLPSFPVDSNLGRLDSESRGAWEERVRSVFGDHVIPEWGHGHSPSVHVPDPVSGATARFVGPSWFSRSPRVSMSVTDPDGVIRGAHGNLLDASPDEYVEAAERGFAPIREDRAFAESLGQGWRRVPSYEPGHMAAYRRDPDDPDVKFPTMLTRVETARGPNPLEPGWWATSASPRDYGGHRMSGGFMGPHETPQDAIASAERWGEGIRGRRQQQQQFSESAPEGWSPVGGGFMFDSPSGTARIIPQSEGIGWHGSFYPEGAPVESGVHFDLDDLNEVVQSITDKANYFSGPQGPERLAALRQAREVYAELDDEDILDFTVAGPYEYDASVELKAIDAEGEEIGHLAWHARTGAVISEFHEREVVGRFLRQVARLHSDLLNDGVELSEMFIDVDHEDQPGRTAGMRRTASYPREWRAEAPFGYIPRPKTGPGSEGPQRARNRPASVPGVDPEDLVFEKHPHMKKVVVRHPETKEPMGSYTWDGNGVIDLANISPEYQGMGLSGAMIDHIREEYQPDLKHSHLLSYQGRAASLRDRGNTEAEHREYLRTPPFNIDDRWPYSPNGEVPTQEQVDYHRQLMDEFEEDQRSFVAEDASPEDLGDDGQPLEFGYDQDGNYVGRAGGYNQDGYDEEGYDWRGYDAGHRDQYGYLEPVEKPADSHEDLTRLLFWGEDDLQDLGPEVAALRDHEDHFDAEVPFWRVHGPHDSLGRVGSGDPVYLSKEQALAASRHATDPLQDLRVSTGVTSPRGLAVIPTEDGGRQLAYLQDERGRASAQYDLLDDPDWESRVQQAYGEDVRVIPRGNNAGSDPYGGIRFIGDGGRVSLWSSNAVSSRGGPGLRGSLRPDEGSLTYPLSFDGVEDPAEALDRARAALARESELSGHLSELGREWERERGHPTDPATFARTRGDSGPYSVSATITEGPDGWTPHATSDVFGSFPTDPDAYLPMLSPAEAAQAVEDWEGQARSTWSQVTSPLPEGWEMSYDQDHHPEGLQTAEGARFTRTLGDDRRLVLGPRRGLTGWTGQILGPDQDFSPGSLGEGFEFEGPSRDELMAELIERAGAGVAPAQALGHT